jgi:hypothetical protein
MKNMKPRFTLRIPSKFLKVPFKSQTPQYICYIINCTKTGKWYVGSGIEGRVWHLSKPNYHNEQLRNDFLEFGVESFKFWIYDCESKEDSILQEQILLDLLPKVSSGAICNPKYSYNVNTNATGGSNYDANNPNDLRNNKKVWAKSSVAGGGYEAKPFEARDATTHKLIASFSSLKDAISAGFFETFKTPDRISNCLKDGTTRSCLLCFWNYSVLIYVRYKNETLKEMELRTGRCFASDVAAKLYTIPEVTVTNGTETHHLKDCKSYSEAASRVGLAEKHWGNFGNMLQGKRPSCDGWRVVT